MSGWQADETHRRIVVIFPAPFGPTTPKISPSATVNEIASTARTESYDFSGASTAMTCSVMREAPPAARCRHPGSLRPRRSFVAPRASPTRRINTDRDLPFGGARMFAASLRTVR
jgi:hypothetical protein